MTSQNGHTNIPNDSEMNNSDVNEIRNSNKGEADSEPNDHITTNNKDVIKKHQNGTKRNDLSESISTKDADNNNTADVVENNDDKERSCTNLSESTDSIATIAIEPCSNKSTSDVFTMTDSEYDKNLCGSKDSGIGNLSTKSEFIRIPEKASDEETSSDVTVDLTEEKCEANGAAFLSDQSTKDKNGTAKQEVLMQMLELPLNGNNGHRMSFMEEESVKDRMRLSLLKQCSAILRRGDEKYTKDSLHKTFQDGYLLERIFRLFDVDRKDYLVQDDWLEFLKERLTEVKQLEFVEQVESVAYVLCGNGVVTPQVFQHIMQNKVVTNKLFRMVDKDNDGNVSADELMDFLSTATSRRSSAGFDKDSMEWLEGVFRKTVGDQQEITIDQFQKIVMSKNKFFTERVFQIIDEDESDSISLQEFIAAVRACRSPDDKLKFLFKVYDLDGDGLIQYPELREVMQACMEENGMQFSDQELTELTSAMFEDADTESRGAITYEALKEQLTRHGGLLENLTISIDRWMVPPKPSEPVPFLTRLKRLKPYQLSLPYFKNNYVYIIYMVLFTLVNVGLFVARCFSYWETNWFTIFARACGQCLNFNCMWILVLMLRGCITQLRVRGLGARLPLDHHIYLHKITGVVVVLFSIFHTIMHICNFSLIVVNDHEHYNRNNYSTYQWLLTETPGQFGLVGGCANPTGFALIVILAVVYICSQPFIRRRGSFQVFYWTHLLYVPFWMLLIFHAPNFWKWFIVPGTIYVIERILRLAWMRSKRGKTYISSGVLKPSRVTHLVIKRPPLFEFHAGDYVFVNIPAIAVYEWHPFTISSAPEEENHIWLHIRGVGQWTNRLYEYFEREQERLHPKDPRDARLCRSSSKRSSTRSRCKSSSMRKKRSVDFSPDSYSTTNGKDKETLKVEEMEISKISPSDTNLLPPVMTHHKTIEKSRSMPDMGNNVKKKQRLQVLCQQMRSESMNNFGECDLKHDPYRDVDAAYQCPHNRALAEDFKYMRNKPTIIAFKTPSVDEYERRRSNESILTFARRRLSKSISPDKDVEGQTDVPSAPGSPQLPPYDPQFNYPVGKPLKIYIDGPYGTPSSHIFKAQHAVLVAAGIGVTPFASILKSIMYRYWNARTQCPNCHHKFTANLAMHNMNLRKVDFFWINREQRSFEWFVSLLSNLEMEQAEKGGAVDRFLEMHLYITSALQKTDMKAVGLQLAMDLLHEKEKRDLITGLKTRTNAGRPNWDKVFQQLQEQHKGKVTVFYCGPPQLARVLRMKCDQFNFIFRKEEPSLTLRTEYRQVIVFYCGPPQLARVLRMKCDQFNFIFRKEVF